MRPDLYDNGLPRFIPMARFSYKTWSSLVIHVMGFCIGFFFFFFFSSARGQDALLGLPLFLWAQGMGLRMALSAAPQPLCTDCVDMGCNCPCVDCHFHVSVRISPDRRH